MFDWAVPHHCQFPVPDPKGPFETECGEPATHFVWWDETQHDSWHLCTEHFEFVRKTEEGRDEQKRVN